jgi:hypothetical protein
MAPIVVLGDCFPNHPHRSLTKLRRVTPLSLAASLSHGLHPPKKMESPSNPGRFKQIAAARSRNRGLNSLSAAECHQLPRFITGVDVQIRPLVDRFGTCQTMFN